MKVLIEQIDGQIITLHNVIMLTDAGNTFIFSWQDRKPLELNKIKIVELSIL